MGNINDTIGKEPTEDILTRPQVLAHCDLLRDIGIFQYIDNLKKEIISYKDLLNSATYIFERITIDDIMDATVWQISEQFTPGFIIFLLRPTHNKNNITIRGYQNYKQADFLLNIESIAPFESFFINYRKPISFDALRQQLHGDVTDPLKAINPEIIVPILGPYGLYSLILIGPKSLGGKYESAELFFLDQLMGFVSQAIQNHLHYESSVRDPKTGLFNHGFLISRLTEEISRMRRTNTVTSLLILDVDKFKSFNDIYGHLAGDKVLEHLAQTLKKSIRTDDIPSRFGGEEFTVLFPCTNRDVCWAVAERIRNNISKMAVPWTPPLPRVTVSVGVVSFDSEDTANEDEIIRRADEALYISKERGRNCTTLWGAGLLQKIENESIKKKK